MSLLQGTAIPSQRVDDGDGRAHPVLVPSGGSTGTSGAQDHGPRSLRVAPGTSPSQARTRHHRRRRAADQEQRFIARLRVTDAVVAAVAALVAHATLPAAPTAFASGHLLVSVAFPFVWLAVVAALRAYEPRYLHVGTEEFRRVAEAGLAVAMTAALASYLFGVDLASGYVLALVLVATGGTLLARAVLRRVLHRKRSSGEGWMRRVLVAGHHEDVRPVLDELGRGRTHGYEAAAVCLADPAPRRDYRVPVFTGLENVVDAAAQIDADAVIILPCRELGAEGIRRLGWSLERTGAQLLIAPGLLDVSSARATVQAAGTMPLLHVNHAELRGVRRIGKEVLERSAAALALLLVSPVLLALVAAVRLDSKGPAVFRQERVGKDDRRFTILKLRTMAVDAEARLADLHEVNEADGALFKIREDPRITRVGRLLRRYSLDELPQLFNVVLGDMSLVGPRPPLPAEVEAYEPDVRRRLVVKPGLTGLWQVSGRSDLPWDEAVRLDLGYVDNWSPMLDMSIVVRTGRAVLSRSGAY